MSRKLIGVIVAVVFLAIIGLAAAQRSDKANAPKSQTSQNTSAGQDEGSSQQSGDFTDLTNQSEVKMEIRNYAYTMPRIKIKKGTKVTWTNRDNIRHNVILDHSSSQPHGAPAPSEVDPKVLAGPLLDNGESYSFTFYEVKSNPYHCSPHPFMKGSVLVVD